MVFLVLERFARGCKNMRKDIKIRERKKNNMPRTFKSVLVEGLLEIKNQSIYVSCREKRQ